jgi:hypothetical protein
MGLFVDILIIILINQTMNKKTENRGGKRLNSGRKKTTESKKSTQIYLSDFDIIEKIANDQKVTKIMALKIVIRSYFDLYVDKSK